MGKVYFLEPVDKTYTKMSPMSRIFAPLDGKIAVKFPKRLADSDAFERECRLWLTVRHRHVVPLLKLSEISGQMAAVMPLYHQNAESLIYESRCNMPETGSFWYRQFVGICEALNYAWEKSNLLHLDLKPQNLLNYSEGPNPYLSVADWGMARFQNYCFFRSNTKKGSERGIESLEAYGGTLPYMSPERILGTIRNDSYMHQVTDDIFSLGIIMMEVATKSNPCIDRSETTSGTIENILTGGYYHIVSDVLKKYPGAWCRLAANCCHPDKRRRPKNYKIIIKELKKYVV